MSNTNELEKLQKLLSSILEPKSNNQTQEYDDEDYEEDYEDDEYDFEDQEYQSKLIKNIDPKLIAAEKEEIKEQLKLLQSAIINLKSLKSEQLSQMSQFLHTNSINDQMSSKLNFTKAVDQTDISPLMGKIAFAQNVDSALETLAEIFVNLDNKVLSRDEINNIYSSLINTIASFKKAAEKKLVNNIDSFEDLMNFSFDRTTSEEFANDPIDEKTYLKDKIDLIKTALIASIYMRVNTEINHNEDTRHWTMNENQVALDMLMFEMIEKIRESNRNYQLKKQSKSKKFSR